MLDPDGLTRTKTLGTDRMTRKLADALPDGPGPLRAAVWEFLRPMLSPRLAALHHSTFVFDEPHQSTVELDKHRSASNLDELDLNDPHADKAAEPAPDPDRPSRTTTPPAREGRPAEPRFFAPEVGPARPVARGRGHVRRYLPAEMPTTERGPLDRVAERKRAVLLAWHYREAEGLPIAQIAQRLDRLPATIKAYFYDPSQANKRPGAHDRPR